MTYDTHNIINADTCAYPLLFAPPIGTNFALFKHNNQSFEDGQPIPIIANVVYPQVLLPDL